MDFKDLKKINYYDLSGRIRKSHIEQCFKTENDKKQFNQDYKNMILNIYSGNEDVLNMCKTLNWSNAQLVAGDSEYVSLLSPAFILDLLDHLCDDKNHRHISERFKQELLSGIIEDEKAMIDSYKNSLKDLRKEIDSIKEYDPKKYENLNCMLIKRLSFNGVCHDYITPKQYGEELKECITRFITYAKTMVNRLETSKIDLKEYNIDVDKYAFIVFSEKLLSLDTNDKASKEIYPLITYFQEVQDNKENAKLEYYRYNKKTQKFDIKYTYKDFLGDLQNYIVNNPNINLDAIQSGFFNNWEMSEIYDYLELYTNDAKRNIDELDPNWTLLPKGEKVGLSYSEDDQTKHHKSNKNYELAIRKKALYDKNRDKIYVTLLGKNKFKGYIANVLNNGYVVLEKYYEENAKLSTKSGAAYIMNIDNFNDLSKKSIQELRDIVKSQPKDIPIYQKINYVCHSGKGWEEKIQAYFDQYTGIKKEHIAQVIVNSADMNSNNNRNIITTKPYQKTIK